MPKVQLQGFCAGCRDPIPVGALVMVERFKTVELAPNLKVQKPEIIYCQKCKHLAAAPRHSKSHHKESHKDQRPEFSASAVPQVQKVQPTRTNVQQVAIALYKAACTTPGTAKQIAQKAGVEHSKVVELILQKLADKKKLKNKGGVWTKV